MPVDVEVPILEVGHCFKSHKFQQMLERWAFYVLLPRHRFQTVTGHVTVRYSLLHLNRSYGSRNKRWIQNDLPHLPYKQCLRCFGRTLAQL